MKYLINFLYIIPFLFIGYLQPKYPITSDTILQSYNNGSVTMDEVYHYLKDSTDLYSTPEVFEASNRGASNTVLTVDYQHLKLDYIKKFNADFTINSNSDIEYSGPKAEFLVYFHVGARGTVNNRAELQGRVTINNQVVLELESKAYASRYNQNPDEGSVSRQSIVTLNTGDLVRLEARRFTSTMVVEEGKCNIVITKI